MEQKLFHYLACNICLLTAQPQAHRAYGIQDTFSKSCDLTSRCGISLVLLGDELRHTNYLETAEQMGSIEDGTDGTDFTGQN